MALARTIAEGIAQLDPPPECIILDLMLPDGDGLDILGAVRSSGLPSRVVVTTGIGDPDRLAPVLALAPDAVLRKPVSLAELFRRLDG